MSQTPQKQSQLELEVNGSVISRSAVRELLLTSDRWINTDELKLVYQGVFPRVAEQSRWDLRLQRRERMPQKAVDEELGNDMRATYQHLVEEQNLLNSGTRPHNGYVDLPTHLWDTAYRAWVMGLDLETRQTALMHSLLDYKARGLEEARMILHSLRNQFGHDVASGIDTLTFWDAILLDHLAHSMNKIGGVKARENGGYLTTLQKISRGYERANVKTVLGEVATLAPNSKKRVIPTELTEGDLVYREARARLHRGYSEKLYSASRQALEDPDQKGENYDNPIMVVEALCLIDKLRTADGINQVERITRESLDFLPHLGNMLNLLQNSNIINNNLALVTAALKAELLTELDQRTSEARGRRDNTFGSYASLLETRLLIARKQYGDVAQQMGYVPMYRVLHK